MEHLINSYIGARKGFMSSKSFYLKKPYFCEFVDDCGKASILIERVEGFSLIEGYLYPNIDNIYDDEIHISNSYFTLKKNQENLIDLSVHIDKSWVSDILYVSLKYV